MFLHKDCDVKLKGEGLELGWIGLPMTKKVD